MTDAVRSCLAMFAMAWRHGRGRLVFSVLATVASGAAWPLLAVALKGATNAAVAHDVHSAVANGILIGVGVIAVLMLQHFAYVPYTEIAERAQISLEAELMVLANGSARLEHHERPEYADKFQLLREEVGEIAPGFTGLFSTVGLLVSVGVTAVVLAQVSPWLLLLPLAAIPPLLAGERAQHVVDRGRQDSATATRQAWHLFRLATTAGPAKELRVLRLQDEVVRRQKALWDQAGTTLAAAHERGTLLIAAGQSVFTAAYVAAVLLAVREAVTASGGVGSVVLVMTLAVQVNQQVSAGLQLLQQLQRMARSLTRLRWMREVVRDQDREPATADVPDVIGEGIRLHGLAFTYPGTERPTMAGVDLVLPAGSTVAVVGENGAGKTTLVKLLCRFYDPTAGRITLDGVDIRRFELRQWRGRIAAGFQDFVRFELPARQTVGVGDLPRMDEEPAVLEALERAHAEDVVAKLAHGLDSHLGKSYRDGRELSGGQWQKLALGRAMMRQNPLLVILDEPTSALDAETEHALFERYAANARRLGRLTGAITILVSHRFSTVRMADLIIVMEDGRLAEAGSHDELMARAGVYADLYRLQASAYR